MPAVAAPVLPVSAVSMPTIAASVPAAAASPSTVVAPALDRGSEASVGEGSKVQSSDPIQQVEPTTKEASTSHQQVPVEAKKTRRVPTASSASSNSQVFKPTKPHTAR